MKGTLLFVSTLSLVLVLNYVTAGQAEAGGGGGRVERTGGSGDTTFKPRAKPVVKRTVPKRIVPKKTAAEYESQGDGFYDQKDYDSAIIAYDNAAKLKPSFHSLYRIGWINNDFGEYAKAVPYLDRALAIDGTQSAAYTEKGYALRRLGRLDEAITALTRALSLSPTDSIPAYELGYAYEQKQMYTEAERFLRQSVRNKSDDSDAYTELGIVERRLGRNTEAINSLNRAIELDPENARAYMGLGDVYYFGTSDYQKAADAYIKGLQYEPDNQAAAFNTGYSYNDLGNYNEALTYLGKANKLKPNDYDTYVETGYANRKLKNKTLAMAAYQKALQLKPGGSNATFGIGDTIYEIDKNYTAAADYYRRGLATDPDNFWALYRLGFCYNDGGNYSQAIDVLDHARRVRPQSVDAMIELGYSYKELKRYNDASTVLRQAISTNRDNALAHYYLGQVFVSTGNKSGANGEYRELERLGSEYSAKLMDLIRQM